ncbi:MAG: DUF1275 domain-containing protein [Myxococcaceae bacterium]|nr:DUF1275 domain-containing protein [Myxococcaceae bacterium]
MHRLSREEYTRKPYVFLWGLLAFQAGFINAFGFLSCGRYVSHITGFGSQIGISLAHSHPLFALELLGFPMVFILGAFIAGLLTIARIERGEKPRFDLIILALPVMLLFFALLGENGFFGLFGEHLVHTRDFFLLYSLSFLCGFQNACFTIMTKGHIRTTHLTGLSTDIGSESARLLFGKLNLKERVLSQRAYFSRILIFVSFAAGSIVSVFICQSFTYFALLLPLLTSLLVWFASRAISQSLDKRYEEDL